MVIRAYCGLRWSLPPIDRVSGSRRSRREILLLSGGGLGAAFVTNRKLATANEQDQLQLVSYTDERNGFTMLRPEKWSQVEKDGAAVLFEDPANKSNSLGVVVNPVRISSLLEFGSPQIVADKLVQAERNKGSTKVVELLGVGSKGGDHPVYEIEYKLDSTRGGMKRIYSAVTIASRKLFIINLAVAIPVMEDSQFRAIVDSFDVLNKN